jgi:hypothetical protein
MCDPPASPVWHAGGRTNDALRVYGHEKGGTPQTDKSPNAGESPSASEANQDS